MPEKEREMKRSILAGLLGTLVVLGTAVLTVPAQGADKQPSPVRDAMRLAHEGKNAEAIALLKQIIQQAPETGAKSAHLHLGFMYFKAKQYDDALAEFNTTIATDRDMPIAYYFMGLIYEAKAKIDKANEAFLESKALDAWKNVIDSSERVKEKPRKSHRGITVKEAVEQAKQHVAKLKEELRDEQK